MSKYKETLVILTPGFAKDETDSTCLPLQQQMIRALKDIMPHLHIFILTFQYPFHTDRYIWFNTTVIPFNGRDKGGIQRLLLRRKLITALEEIHNTTPITGLLSFWYGECAAVGKLFADRYDLKHFCWILGQDARKGNKYPSRSKLPADNLIALSDFLQTEFEKNHGVRARHVIAAGINPALFNAGKKGKEKEIDIIGVGSLIPLKRYDLFLAVIADLKKQKPAIQATLIGKGPEKERLQKLIIEMQLQGNVTLLGELPYDDVLACMQNAKILLHPSSYEGFSGVCLEALYAGCHVISFCKAMNHDIEKWHIVESQKEMTEEIRLVLEAPSPDYKIVQFCTTGDLVKKIAALFFKEI